MRKIRAAGLVMLLILSLSGCSDKTLTHYGNLGYDFSKTKYESVAFKVYHSNTEDHTWELLKTFVCTPAEQHFADIRLEGSENCITITSEENYVEKTQSTETYFTDDIETCQFAVDGFSGWIVGFATFEVKNTDEEQIYRLYPISNEDSGTYFQEIKLDKPYDEEEENLDNILITIRFQ